MKDWHMIAIPVLIFVTMMIIEWYTGNARIGTL